MAPDMPAVIIQGASTAGERVVDSSLATLAGDAEREGIGAPAIVVIGKIAGLRRGMLTSMVDWQ
jgi:siroheme synthase